jgi:hypothetical protein
MALKTTSGEALMIIVFFISIVSSALSSFVDIRDTVMGDLLKRLNISLTA